MASRETSRTLGRGQQRVRFVEAAASEDAENRDQGPLEAVQAGKGSGARSAVESTVLDGANKRQRTDELSTGEHQAAPPADHAAPQDTSYAGALPRCEPHPGTGKRLQSHHVLIPPRPGKLDLPPKAAETMQKAAQCIFDSTAFDAALAGELPIANTLTNGLLELAWESINGVVADADRPSGLVMKAMLARLVASAWRGAAAPAKLDREAAEKVGKRLHKQVDTKIKGLLSEASSKAVRARAALSKASAEEGLHVLAEKKAAIDSQEREDCAAIRCTLYPGFTELDTEPEAAAAPSMAEPSAVEPQAAAEPQAAVQAESVCPGAAELAQHGGIPRLLAWQLGEDGCAAVERYLETVGGVSLPADPRGVGAFVAMENGKLRSLSWEEGLCHTLPSVVGALEAHNQCLEEAIQAQQEALDVAVQNHKEMEQLLHDASEREAEMRHMVTEAPWLKAELAELRLVNAQQELQIVRMELQRSHLIARVHGSERPVCSECGA